MCLNLPRKVGHWGGVPFIYIYTHTYVCLQTCVHTYIYMFIFIHIHTTLAFLIIFLQYLFAVVPFYCSARAILHPDMSLCLRLRAQKPYPLPWIWGPRSVIVMYLDHLGYLHTFVHHM